MDISVIAGIAILVLYGLADFFTAIALKHEKTIKILVFGGVISVLVTLPVFYYFLPVIKFNLGILAVSILAGIIGCLSLFSFFEGIKVDKVSVVAPLANVWPIITAPLAIIFLSENLSIFEMFGAALVLCGIVSLSLKTKKLRNIQLRRLTRGLKYGFGAMIGWSLLYFIVGALAKETTWIFAPFVVIVVQTVIFIAYFVYKKEKVHVEEQAVRPLILQALFNTAGFLLFGFGSVLGNIAILSPLAAASPFLVVILAYVFLKERLSTHEKLGIALLILGTVLLSF
ncbi:MAG: DMT family transporter [Candidatus Marsarchaeota archaeon]|nr:DMT family transporter [Candidatus Marsarchaeota archaeon]